MAATAAAFQSGRVFLAGDAAHVMPPTGGFGGNTGVADAYNLAWKLAFATQGVAGPGLLDTYGAERRPISALTVEQAYTRYALRVDPSLPRDDLMPPLDDAAIELGSIYQSSAVLPDHAPERQLDDPHARTWTVGAGYLTFRCGTTGARSRRWTPLTMVSPCWQTTGTNFGGGRRTRPSSPSASPSP